MVVLNFTLVKRGNGFLLGVTGAILLCAFFVDVIVWYKAGSIDFVNEQVPLEVELHVMPGKDKEEPE